MGIIEHLAEDHKRIVQNINKLPPAFLKARQSIETLLTLSGEIEQQLSRHEETEDRILFPALRGKISDQSLQSLIKEHEESKKARELFLAAISDLKEIGEPFPLDKIKEMSNQGYKLMRILSTHLTREDQILFPMAKTILTPDQLEELERQTQQLG